MQLNITNGHYFNEYIKTKKDGVFVPFNEALIDGKLLFPLFDKSFLLERVKVHNTTKQEYLSKMQLFFNPEEIKQYHSIVLWFGLDAFCQINMLALLAYLEQIDFEGKVFYQPIDDVSFNVIDKQSELILGDFLKTYKSLVFKQCLYTNYEFLNKGINDYLYVKDKNNRFYEFIRKNLGALCNEKLLIYLLNDSLSFGLSDQYIQKMIDEIKNAVNG